MKSTRRRYPTTGRIRPRRRRRTRHHRTAGRHGYRGPNRYRWRRRVRRCQWKWPAGLRRRDSAVQEHQQRCSATKQSGIRLQRQRTTGIRRYRLTLRGILKRRGANSVASLCSKLVCTISTKQRFSLCRYPMCSLPSWRRPAVNSGSISVDSGFAGHRPMDEYSNCVAVLNREGREATSFPTKIGLRSGLGHRSYCCPRTSM